MRGKNPILISVSQHIAAHIIDGKVHMKFRVVSYNILADSYIRPDRYRHVPPELLEPNQRMLSICSRTAELTADIMCLQEVEERAVDVLQTRFEPEGYESIFHKKGMNRPDGCLTLISRSTFSLEFSKAIYFADG